VSNLQVLKTNPTEALKSPSWLSASPETVQEVVQSDNTCVSEPELFKAVVEWGNAQVEKANPDLEPDPTEVRSKIFPFLKSIRFTLMDSMQFTELCKTDTILTAEEKLNILMCLSAKSVEFMPNEFAGASQSPRKLLAVFDLPYVPSQLQPGDRHHRSYSHGRWSTLLLTFSVDKKARLVGVQVHPSDPTYSAELKNVVMELTDEYEGQTCSMYPDGSFVYQDKKYIRLRKNVDLVLTADLKYSLLFTRPEVHLKEVYSIQSLSPLNSGLMTLTLSTTKTLAPFSALIFELIV